MHPYRTPFPSESESDVAASEPELRLAFRVMTFVGAVQVASAILQPGPPSLQTLFGGACFIAGMAWLLRHRQVERRPVASRGRTRCRGRLRSVPAVGR
jgi:hypothetical protein